MEQEEQVETWFRLYHRDIFNYLVYYTGTRDVEDLVQEVFIKAIKSQYQIRERSSVKTWLFRIARNCAIDQIRHRRLIKWVPEGLLKLFLSEEKEPMEVLETKEDVHQLYRAIRSLKTTYRDVILLRYLQGLSVRETSEVLDWSESKVNTTVHRALKQLRGEMEAEQGGINIGTIVR